MKKNVRNLSILVLGMIFLVSNTTNAFGFDLVPEPPAPRPPRPPTPPADTTRPTIIITSHSNMDEVEGIITISASASDNVKVSYVAFNIGDRSIGSDSNAPYSVNIDTREFDDGIYQLKVSAVDTSGNYAQDIIEIKILPTIKITSHSNMDEVEGIITISASVSDKIEISEVKFYIGDKILDSDSNAPYSINTNTRKFINGIHQLKVSAIDSSGYINQDMIEIEIVNDVILLYDESFSLLRQDTFALLDINFQVKLWSDQRVEFYATYMFKDLNPNVACFDLVAVQAGSLPNYAPMRYNEEIPHRAPYVLETGSTYVDGDVPLDKWYYGDLPIYIKVQLRFQSCYNLPGGFYSAFQSLRLYNMGSFAQGDMEYDGVEISDKQIIPIYL